MKLIIAGSRGLTNRGRIVATAMEMWDGDITEIVHGGCRGIDEVGGLWAIHNGIKPIIFNPDWARHGKAAGPIRNNQMAKYADALVAIWDGESKGTWGMIKRADKLGLKMLLITVGETK